MAPGTLRVIAPDVGGGFGARIGADREAVAVVWAAHRLRRPVRWTETRSENLVAMTHGRDQVQHLTIGGGRDGRIRAFRLDVIQDTGAYPRMSGFLPTMTSLMSAGVYDIPALETAGEREIPAREFFRSLFGTALEPGELLAEIRIPRPPVAGWGYEKFTRRGIDWAIVGVAVQGRPVGLINMGPVPLRADFTEQALAGGAAHPEAAALAAEGTSPPADGNGSAGYRQHLARVLTRRALDAAGGPWRPGALTSG